MTSHMSDYISSFLKFKTALSSRWRKVRVPYASQRNEERANQRVKQTVSGLFFQKGGLKKKKKEERKTGRKKERKKGGKKERKKERRKQGRKERKRTTATTTTEIVTTKRKKMEHVMEHIAQNHMLPMHCQGKSYFLSSDRKYVLAMVKDTTERPDTILPHKYRKDREVRKKKFPLQVGVHGITKVACYCVTVIFSVTNNEIISAFPTV